LERKLLASEESAWRWRRLFQDYRDDIDPRRLGTVEDTAANTTIATPPHLAFQKVSLFGYGSPGRCRLRFAVREIPREGSAKCEMDVSSSTKTW
jgi:hypothetical protein